MSQAFDSSQTEKGSTPGIIVVAGTFDDKGWKISSYIEQFHAALPKGTALVNGGAFSQIPGILEKLGDFDIVFWLPNIPNDKEKLRDIKKLYPEKILVTAKRNHETNRCQYSLQCY